MIEASHGVLKLRMNSCGSANLWLVLMELLVFGLQSLPQTAGTQLWPTNSNTEANGSTNKKGIFINVNSPVPINGTAVAWHYCFYPPTNSGSSDTLFTVQFATFRGEFGILDINYHQNAGTLTTVNKMRQEISSIPDFTCEVLPLTRDMQFPVIEGHMIGACLYGRDGDDEQVDSLTVVGQGETVGALEFDSDSCMNFDGKVVLWISTVTLQNEVMHVSLEIEPGEQLSPHSSSSSLSSSSLSSSSPSSSSPSSSSYSSSSSSLSSSFPPSSYFSSPSTSYSSSSSSYSSSTTVSGRTSAAAYITRKVTTAATSTRTPVESPAPYRPRNTGYPKSDQAKGLGSGAAVGVSVGSVLVVMVLVACVLVLVVVLVKKRNKKELTRPSQHRHVGMDHFVIVQPSTYEDDHNEVDAIPYEVPVCSLRSYRRRVSEENRAAISLPQRSSAPAASHYEFDPDFLKQQQAQEQTSPAYHHLNTVVTAVQPSKGNRYSVLCQHYYKVLEQALELYEDEGANMENPYLKPAATEEDLYEQLGKQKIKSIPVYEIKATSRLGSGQFGSVRKGVWKPPTLDKVHDVALKTLVHTHSDSGEDRIKLLQEAVVMGQFSHPNVIKLLGVAISDDVVMLVMDFASLGDLEKHLLSLNPKRSGKTLPPDTPNGLLCFAQQIVFGMHYLSSKGFVHRDLAARNILLADGSICKIADFGMSRDLAKKDYYLAEGGIFPVKWTAPEALNFMRFSTASDIWSYGCLLYEIWSLGKAPFSHLTNSEVVEVVNKGFRQSPPPGCPRAMYQLMVKCWNPVEEARPSFRDLMVDLMEENVLKLPDDATAEARKLGGLLKAGFQLYRDLQGIYISLPQEDAS